MYRLLLSLLLLLPAGPVNAATVHIAVAANFSEAARQLAEVFRQTSGHQVRFSVASTGQLFAQATYGAPYDLLLAADQQRPTQAIRDGLGVANSQFTYAIGRLALYSRDSHRVTGPQTLSQGAFTRLAIANPNTAPYGKAAIDLLQNLGLYELLAPRLVRGNNVAQAFQFVATGNAELGLVALSQVMHRDGGSSWLVPATLHSPIAQDAVLLTHGADNPAALAFINFLRSQQAATIIQQYGYQSAMGLPPTASPG